MGSVSAMRLADHPSWFCGLLLIATFALIGACLSDAVGQGLLRPFSLFFVFWILQALFSGPGLWIYHGLGAGREHPFGKPFMLHPETTARLLWLISLGLAMAWFLLRNLPDRRGGPILKSLPDPRRGWWWSFLTLTMYLLFAAQAGWFSARGRVGSELAAGSPLYVTSGLLALVAPFFFLSGVRTSEPAPWARQLGILAALLGAGVAMVMTGARVYVAGAGLVFLAGLCWQRLTLRNGLAMVAGLLSLLSLMLITYALRAGRLPDGRMFCQLGLQEKFLASPGLILSPQAGAQIRAALLAISYRTANVYSQEAIDQMVENPQPKIGNRNLARLRGLFIPRIVWRDKPSVDDGPERMADWLGRPREDKFNSAPLGLTADLLERYGDPGTILAAFLLGIGWGATGWFLCRTLPILYAGILLSPVFFAMPNITDCSLLALINRLTYQNLRDFILIFLWMLPLAAAWGRQKFPALGP